MQPPFWVDGQILLTPPSFTWGNRVSNATPNYAPPNMTYPGFLNINATKDISISLTKVAGRHTLKTGFYNTHSHKAQNQTAARRFGTLNFRNDTSNPLDTTFGFANAALGIFSSYNQVSRYIEGQYIYNNTEGYVQDNWKVNNKLTLDYGVRLRAPAAAVRRARPGVELPARGVDAWARRRCCTSPAAPTASTRARAPTGRRGIPLTGQFLGVGSAIGDRHDRAEHRQHPERPVPVRPGHRQDDLHLAGAAASRRASAWPTT